MEKQRTVAHHDGKTFLASQRGVVLILSYLTVSVLLILQAAYSSRVVHDHKHALRYDQRLQALHYAEAGLDQAMDQLRLDAAYPGSPTTSLGVGAYQSTVTPSGDPLTLRRVLAQGYALDPNRPDAENRLVEAVVHEEENRHNFGLFAQQSMDIQGALQVDGYNSNTGAPMDLGEIGTNATAANSISVNGSTTLSGKAACGPGCASTTAITFTGPATYDEKVALEAAKPFPAPSVPQNAVAHGDVTVVQGTTLTLSAGEHSFTNLTLERNAQVLGSGGSVDIYITGNLTMERNSKMADGNLPPQMHVTFVDSGSGNAFSATQNPTVYAAVYGPALDLDVTSSMTIYGSLMGRSIAMNGGTLRVHQDAALAKSLAINDHYATTLAAWKDTPPAGGGGCFVAATPVMLADGSQRAIIEIRVGDMVRAFDPATQALTTARVIGTSARERPSFYRLRLSSGTQLEVTGEHPFYVPTPRPDAPVVYEHFIEVRHLAVGDTVRQLEDGNVQPARITSISFVPGSVTVYNLTVDQVSTYIAGGVLVHNKLDPGPPP